MKGTAASPTVSRWRRLQVGASRMVRPMPTESPLSRRSIPPWGGVHNTVGVKPKAGPRRVCESCDTWTVPASVHTIFCIPHPRRTGLSQAAEGVRRLGGKVR
jgi:hypothetical protein